MKQFISQTIGILNGLFQSDRNLITQFCNAIINLFSTYSELFRTGGIQSTVEGEKVIVNLTANVCGDILVFIGPKDAASHTYSEVIEMILTDRILPEQKKIAMESLRAKFQGLMVLPNMLTGLISIILPLLVYLQASNIQALSNYKIDLAVTQKVFPLVLFLIAVIFRKFVGFKLIALGVWLIKFLKQVWQRLKQFFR